MTEEAIERPWIEGTSEDAPRPPFAKGLPLLGNMMAFVGDPLDTLRKEYERLGPIYRMKVPGQEWVVIAGVEANRLMIHAGSDLLVQGESYQGFNEAFDSKSFLITLDGPRQLHLRKVQQRAMGRAPLLARFDEAVRLVDDVTRDWKEGDVIDAIPLLKRLVVRQLGVAVTSKDPTDLIDDVQTVLNHIVNVAQLKKWPKLVYKLPWYKNAKRHLLEDTRALVARHRGRKVDEALRDLIDDMLAATDVGGAPMQDETIWAAVSGAYMAGLDTAAITVAFALHALLSTPDALERVRREVDQAFANGLPDAEAFQSLEALRGATMETLRRYPVAALLTRDAAKDFVFHGHQVKKGDQLLIGTGVAHFDPKLFPEPETFDIDRFSATRAEHKQPGAYAPFGLGPHRCLGAGMGELQTQIVVGRLLQQFELALEPDSRELHIVMKPLRRPETLRLRVVRRRQPARAAA